MRKEQTIFLIGFMGSGKSFWAQQIAQNLDIPLCDLDAMIEELEGMPVHQVFEQKGEAAFRDMERTYLRSRQLLGYAVVAAGGGTPCFFDNMDWMNKHGLTIYLNTPVPILADRLKNQRQARPLLAAVPESELENHIEWLLSTRRAFYQQAQITLDQTQQNIPFFEQMLMQAIKGSL